MADKRGEIPRAGMSVAGRRARQFFVPKDWESRVRLWVQDYHSARELMEEV